MCSAETNETKISKIRNYLSKKLPSYMIPKIIKLFKNFQQTLTVK